MVGLNGGGEGTQKCHTSRCTSQIGSARVLNPTRPKTPARNKVAKSRCPPPFPGKSRLYFLQNDAPRDETLSPNEMCVSNCGRFFLLFYWRKDQNVISGVCACLVTHGSDISTWRWQLVEWFQDLTDANIGDLGFIFGIYAVNLWSFDSYINLLRGRNKNFIVLEFIIFRFCKKCITI